MRRFVLLTFLTAMFPISVLFSQSGGLGFMLGFPQGDFKQNVNRTGYGGGGGLMIKLHESEKGEAKNGEAKNGDPKIGSVWLDLKSRYLFGTEASYLKEGSVVIENGKVTYNPSRSTTDLLTFQIGVVLYFR